ncbi:MAG: PSD1 and planctomycete cytochrome C domain-containing protein [Akkermansiaceae bacterium]
MFLLASGVKYLGAALMFGSALFAEGADALSFNRDIRPILSEKCFACHGMDEESREAKLRLDTPEGAFRKKRQGKSALVPGRPDESESWLRIVSDDEEEVMPPPDSHKTLNDEEKKLIRQWIEEGASYQKHWAFEAPVMPVIPAGEGSEIDRFVESDLKETGWQMSSEADRTTLIRRVSFTLTGLPPSIGEVDQFLADQVDGAYGRMVDRFLASPRYGEEMARHWLDAARYGDTHGMHLDNERQIWAYRDWVIKSFNDNLPYDDFTIEQLGGDLLPNPKVNQMVATGFNRCNVTTGEGGSIKEEFIFRYAVDRASTTAQVWLGLTAQCAVCHDHKYDPISQKDFYSLYAFFNSNADPAMDGNKLLTAPVIKVKSDDYDSKIAEFDARADAVVGGMKKLPAWSSYQDPAEQESPGLIEETETIWFEDGFPKGAKVGSSGHPLTLVDQPVSSGKKSLKRGGKEMAQDYYESGAVPLTVPPEARFFLNVFLDPNDTPEEVMIQFHTSGWSHRAVWGADIIDFGRKGTSERFVAGSLPEKGRWVRLEVSGAKMGLKAGMQVSGFAFTVHGGTGYFDRFGVLGREDPTTDPKASFLAWRKAKQDNGVPAPLSQWLREGVEKVRKPSELAQLQDYYLARICGDLGKEIEGKRSELTGIESERANYEKSVPSTFVFRDLPKPRQSYVMKRGEYNQPGEKVEPGTPSVLPALVKSGERATRLDLARWLVSRENPLTSRVVVNRFWQQVFGTGLVKTSHDFGTQGEVPSHPELLDYLALRFQETDWDIKSFMRELVMTKTFRQESAAASPRWDNDSDNRRLARGPRFRLDAEQLRDQALFVSGLIDFRMGGRGVMPYQPPNIWEPVAFGGSNTRFYKRGNGADLYRRTIYTFFKRTAPHPMFGNFDAPAREQFCLKRERSNTPLQALQLMNDVQHFEAARGLGQRAMKNSSEADERIDFVFRSVLSRLPGADEKKIISDFFEKQLAKYQGAPDEAMKAITFGQSEPAKDLVPAELAAWSLVANLILNMDEAIVRN